MKTHIFTKSLISCTLCIALAFGMSPFTSSAFAQEQSTQYDAAIEAALAQGSYVEGDVLALVYADLADESAQLGFHWPWEADEPADLVEGGEQIMCVSTEAAEEALDTSIASSAEVAQASNLTQIESTDDEELCIILISSTELSTRELMYALASYPRVVSVEPNYIVDTCETNQTQNEDAQEELASAQTQDNVTAQSTHEVENQDTTESASSLQSNPTSSYAAVCDENNSIPKVDGHYDLSNLQWMGVNNSNYTSLLRNDSATLEGFDLGCGSWNDEDAEDNAAGVVAIVDTGIDFTNPDLDGLVATGVNKTALEAAGGSVYGYKADCGQAAEANSDVYGHGTHCAGIVAAEWNGFGTSGVAKGCEVISVRIANEDATITDASVIKAYEFLSQAIDNGLNLVATNNSWGASIFHSNFMGAAVSELGRKGAVTCFSSGNSSYDNDNLGETADTLSQNPYAIVVNAVDHYGVPASFTSYGQRSSDVYGAGVEVASTCTSPDCSVTCGIADTDPLYRNYFASDYSSNLAIMYSDAQLTNLPTTLEEVSQQAAQCSADSLITSATVEADTGALRFNSTTGTESLNLLLAIPVKTDQIENIAGLNFFTLSISNTKYKGTYGFVYAGKDGGVDLEKTEEGRYSLSARVGWCSKEYSIYGQDCSLYTVQIDSTYSFVFVQLAMNPDSSTGTVDYAIDCLSICSSESVENGDACRYAIWDGTSMACPSVAGTVAVAAKRLGYSNTAQSAIDLANYVKAHVISMEGAENTCKQGGMVNLAVSETTPVINKIEQSDSSTEVTLSGAYFGDTAGMLSLGEQTLVVQSWSDNQIVAEVPESLASGELVVAVTATNGKTGRSTLDYVAPSGLQEFSSQLTSPDSSIEDGGLGMLLSTGYIASDSNIAYPASMHALDGKVYAILPNVQNGSCSDALYCYDPQTDSWSTACALSTLPSVQEANGSLAAFSMDDMDGKLYLFGIMEIEETWLKPVLFVYDPSTGETRSYDTSCFELTDSQGKMEGAKFVGATLCNVDGTLMLFGGRTYKTKAESTASTENIAELTLSEDAVSYQVVGSATHETACEDPGFSNAQVAVTSSGVYIGSFSPASAYLLKATRSDDGSWSSQDVSSLLPALTPSTYREGSLEIKSYTTPTSYLPFYGMVADGDDLYISGFSADAGDGTRSAADTYVLKSGADCFTAFTRTASVATLYFPCSTILDGRLYTLGGTLYAENEGAEAFKFSSTPLPRTVTYNANGHGSAPAAVTLDAGSTLERPENPQAQADNVQFAGWFTDEACTQAWDFATPVIENMTLYAKWEAAGSGGTTGKTTRAKHKTVNTGDDTALFAFAISALVCAAGAAATALIRRKQRS